jgi:hypothetical protein
MMDQSRLGDAMVATLQRQTEMGVYRWGEHRVSLTSSTIPYFQEGLSSALVG